MAVGPGMRATHNCAMQHTRTSLEEQLRQADTVVQRLVPLTDVALEASPAMHEHLAAAWAEQIQTLVALERFTEAHAAADAWLAHLGDTSGERALVDVARWPQVAQAHCEKAQALSAGGQTDTALEVLDSLQQRFAQTESLAVREWLAGAGLAEVQLRGRQGATFARVDMVRRAHQLAQTYGDDDWPATQVVVAQLRLTKGRLLAALDYAEEALKEWTALWHFASGSQHDRVREIAADAKLECGRTLTGQERWSEALASHTDLINSLASTRHPGSRDTLALALLDRLGWWRDGHLPVPPGSTSGQQISAACEAMRKTLEEGPPSLLVDRSLSRCLSMYAEVLRERAEDVEEEQETEESGKGAESSEALQAQAQVVAQTLWSRYAGHADAIVRRTALNGWMDAIEYSEFGSDASVQAYRAIIAQRGEETNELLQGPLVEVWSRLADAQHVMGAYGDAQTTLQAMQGRFVGVADAEVRRRLGHLTVKQARWLVDDQQRFDEALALLAGLPEGADAHEGDRWMAILRLDAVAHLWSLQTPPAHPHQSGEDDAGEAVVVGVLTASEMAYARTVGAMVERFSQDTDSVIRRLVADRLYSLAVHQRERLHFEAARDSYQQYLNRFSDDTDPEIEHDKARVYLNLAYLLMMLMQHDAEALVVYDALLTGFGQRADPRYRELLAKAAASRLTCLNRLQRQGVEVSYGEDVEDLPLEKRDALQSLLNEARALYEAKQHRPAIGVYDRLLDAHGESTHPELRRLCLDAMVNKGYCLGQLGQREKALAVNNDIIARYGHEANTTAEKDVALAYANKAVQLDRLGRHDEELATYDEIIVRWSASSVSYLRMRVAYALYAKGLTLAERDSAVAEGLYREVIDRYLRAPQADVRLQAAKAVVDLGALLRKAGRPTEAVAACEAPLASLAQESASDIVAQVEKIRVQIARGYREADQHEEAVAAYRVLLDAPPKTLSKSTLTELRREYASLNAGRSWFEKMEHWLTRLLNP